MLVKYTENYEDTQSGHELCTLNKLNKTKKTKIKRKSKKRKWVWHFNCKIYSKRKC